MRGVSNLKQLPADEIDERPTVTAGVERFVHVESEKRENVSESSPLQDIFDEPDLPTRHASVGLKSAIQDLAPTAAKMLERLDTAPFAGHVKFMSFPEIEAFRVPTDSEIQPPRAQWRVSTASSIMRTKTSVERIVGNTKQRFQDLRSGRYSSKDAAHGLCAGDALSEAVQSIRVTCRSLSPHCCPAALRPSRPGLTPLGSLPWTTALTGIKRFCFSQKKVLNCR
jgi:hypothetical protein